MHRTRKSRQISESKCDKDHKNVENFQLRLAEESEEIIQVKFAKKIQELDELCGDSRFGINRVKEVREATRSNISQFLKRTKEMEGEQERSSNPFLKLLTGGYGGGEEEEGEEGEEEEGEGEEEVGGKVPNKLLLDKIKLSENNKINLRLCLELEQPERPAKSDSSEPPAKKPKQSESETKETETAEIRSETDYGTPRSTTEDVTAVTEKEVEKKEEKKPDPVLKSQPFIVELGAMIKPHIDQIASWCVTLRAHLLTCVARNKNIGGADLNGEIQQLMVEEVKGIEDEFLSYKELMASYYIARAGILNKVKTEPEIEDYVNFILDEDEKMFLSLRSTAFALRNQTMNLYDAIVKDIDRLFPEATSSSQQSAMFSMY